MGMEAERRGFMAGHDLHSLSPGQLVRAHRAFAPVLRRLADPVKDDSGIRPVTPSAHDPALGGALTPGRKEPA